MLVSLLINLINHITEKRGSQVYQLDYSEKNYKNDFKGNTLACAFHAHSDIGSLDGASTVDNMMKRMAKLGMTHATFTEHGSINSAATIHRLAKKHKLKIIHGVEAYLYWPGEETKQGKKPRTYHINIFFKTRQAFEAYCKLTPLLYSPPRVQNKFGDYKPCMYWDDFVKVAEKGIIVGTACVGGWMNRVIIDDGDFVEAERRLQKMIDLVGVENIYDEWIVDDLSYNYNKESKEFVLGETKLWLESPDIGKECNRIRWPMTKARGIKRVASQDSHYAVKSDKVIQDNKRWKNSLIFAYFQHIKGAEEYAELAMQTQGISEEDCIELIQNTHEFCTHFDNYEFLTVKERGFVIPKFKGDAKAEIYKRIAETGNVDLNDPVYQERIEYELSVLNCDASLDGLSYIILASDIAKLARDNGILTNTRGSAGGCLSVFAIGLSTTNPILYDLQFERFLTAGRIKTGNPPDVDMDFSNKTFQMKLMEEKYGARLMPISIDTLFKPKSAIKDIERYKLGAVRPETEILCKSMDTIGQGIDSLDWLNGYVDDTGDHIPGALETHAGLKAYADNNPELWENVIHMCGVMRQKGVHASGVLVTEENVETYLPVIRIGDSPGVLCTGYGPKDCEYVGAMKIDILGVDKMATIEECLKMVEERTGTKLTWGKFPEDFDTYKNVYWLGDTEGTFQTHTPGITDLCKKCRPRNISEVSNMVSLYRPSCLDAPSLLPEYKNLVDYYVGVQQGKSKAVFIHDDLKAIYGRTMGVPLEQEQLLKMFRDFANYSYEKGETVRRAVSKKDAKTLAECMEDLKKGCREKGWSEEQIDQLRDFVMASSLYGFNRAHSVSYAIVSYHTAYLKYHYPMEFWAAELTVETNKTSDNADKLGIYASLLQDKIVQPDVLKSKAFRWTIDGDKLVAPLVAIKSVGEVFAPNLLKIIQADSLEDLGLILKSTEKKGKKASNLSIFDDFD